jgi:AmiR/NasT family two-component response regulator
VLVADDDRLIVATLGQRLRGAGYEVIEAFDGPSALAACASAQPDLAVIDHSMPGMTGVEVARALAASGGVPVIFLSAYSDETIVDDAVASGAITYIVKPIDTEQLLPIVRAALQRAREIRALREQNERLRMSLSGEQSVSAAAGLLMASLKLGQREAFERLRHRARSQRLKLEDVAAQLLRAHDEAGKLLQEYAAPLRSPKSGETDPR